tara:strand:+ start:81 stop:449 length:369 start_codon:yes stop_codon:yes gene_type:complete
MLIFCTNAYSFINKSCEEYLKSRNIFNNPLYDHLNSNFTDKNITFYNLTMMNSAKRYFWYGFSYAANDNTKEIVNKFIAMEKTSLKQFLYLLDAECKRTPIQDADYAATTVFLEQFRLWNKE